MILIDSEKGIKMIKKSFVIGLPNSGKTTFLGALAYSLLNNTCNKSAFVMDEIDNVDYIAGLADIWSQCKEVDRTLRNNYVITRLFLKDKDGNKLELLIPDQSGEDFKDIISNRSLTDKMHNALQNCDNIFLFINPSKISTDSFINDIKPEFRNSVGEKIDIFGNDIMHEQTQYVLLLQDVSKLRSSCTKLKVIISAWDVYDVDVTPSELLSKELPLVWQYLKANDNNFECEYWGISAQGGDLSDPEEQIRLQSYNNAIERIQVINEDKEVSHDLSILLK